MDRINRMRTFQDDDMNIMVSWFEDSEVHKRLGGMLPLQEWYSFAKDNKSYNIWVAEQEGKIIGISMVEIEEGTGSIALLIDPSLRGKGLGKEIIRKTMLLGEMKDLKKWFAGIEMDNIACLKCFESNGYSYEDIRPDEDGYYSLIYIPDVD
ncbi:TPA: GNAT family N-acetyltransferase [Bacillus pseudomycoides]|nr:GNAT family N-acetyltransferase [Bacillus pseudomycoides]